MTADPTCTFCKIISKEIPSESVYENEFVSAFLDINPVNPGHLLVVPKEHYPDFLSTPDPIIKEVVAVTHKLAGPMMKATDATAFNIAVNSGHDAGQAVAHMHMHLIPRHHQDGHHMWPGKPYQPGEMAAIRSNLQAELQIQGDATPTFDA